ncbi:MAG: tripartite tricarboxylate transporter substrate binding protein [Betaproteobacteria bacterium]|nr:tripartite tricarboxylate transporter substrate binding protein [Betaproteobacteria bacterium]
MKPAVKTITLAVFSIFAWSAAGSAHAQSEYPARPIRLIVGFAPGGGTDIVARIVANKLDEAWRQRVIVDNRPGAGQIIAAELTARATPDGYTVFMAAAGFTILPAFNKKLPFDPVRDFSTIAMAARAPNVLVVSPSLGARSVKDLITLARAKPGQLSFGSGGVGAPSHVSGVLFGALGGIDVTHVPYKGSGPVMVDLLGGQLAMSFPDLATPLSHIKAGRLLALAVTTRERSALLPDVPTMAESGIPGYEASSWFAMIGPAGMPKPVVAKLNAALNRILQEPDVRNTLRAQGATAVGGSPAELASTISGEIAKWTKLMAKVGIKPE